MSDPSFTRMATVTFSTKRSAMSGGVGGAPVAVLTGQKCTPLDPVNSETVTRLKLDSAYEVRQTFVDTGSDVRKGDTFIAGGISHLVKAVEDFEWRGATFLRLYLEKIAPVN